MASYKKIPVSAFRHKVTFFQEVAQPDGMGGHSVQLVELLTTWAAKDQARTTLGYNDLLEIAAGKVMEGRDIELTIRYRKDFFPAKDMRIEVEGVRYTLTNPGTPLGEPVQYIRIVGTKIHNPNAPTGGNIPFRLA